MRCRTSVFVASLDLLPIAMLLLLQGVMLACWLPGGWQKSIKKLESLNSHLFSHFHLSRVPWDAVARANELVERTLAESVIPSLPGPSFTFVVRGLGSFGEKIVFAEIGSGRDQLIAMNAVFREAFESAGFECDARFTPHITVLKAVNVRIAHLRIAHWGAILRWAILSQSVIRIAHLNYYVFYVLFVLDISPW